ncbi:hypothetical protein SAMN06265379_101266 [Saccharicrinis carchari]|uniref:Uncharacterized protein n=1 Tax=Saccharicrinis carchari TaxID=1168039 RepID=A0A521AMQ9_SACCC|nr:hypothetical protein SAMN06265379_101266 [Saccharicrinis carchari]
MLLKHNKPDVRIEITYDLCGTFFFCARHMLETRAHATHILLLKYKSRSKKRHQFFQ